MKLIENIGIYKSCSFIELTALFSFAFFVLFIAVLLLSIPIGIGLAASSILSIFMVSLLLAPWYQNKKRNLPERFHMKKIALIVNGFFGVNVQNNTVYSSFSHQ
ncbi:hypothetical protein [Candidatus Thiodubiliella endoseptemdiera]|uniref:hypothetical protein n=1 Tax=Candidatus Thiodubiliella endoseptemdiera TaxID=2738886 RepID=UPI0034DF7A56